MPTATSTKKTSDAATTVSRFEMSSTGHRLDTRAGHTCAMAQNDDSDRQAWLDALNALVQIGLVEVVAIAE